MEKMVHLHCRSKHGSAGHSLCSDCAALLDYMQRRTDCCPRMADKMFCSGCPHPCYRPDMRTKVRAVMRYAAPRMLWHDPLLVIRHVALSRRDQRKSKQLRRNQA